jgi:siderophore synthetase component/predicted MFS family arabinose efflux permease
VTSRADRQRVLVVVLCHFVASFAVLGFPPYFPEILPQLGGGDVDYAGLLYVLPTVCTALSAPLWGRLADRHGRKRLLIRAQLGLAVAFVLAAAADDVPAFAAALALQGLLGGTFAASHAYLAALVPASDLSRAFTLMHTSARAALVVAPVTVGLLSPWVNIQDLYGIGCVLPLLAAVVVARLPEPDRAADSHRHKRDVAVAPRTGRWPWALFGLEFAFVFATVVSFPYFLPLLTRISPELPGAVEGLLFALPHLVFLTTARPLFTRVSGRPVPALTLGLAGVATGMVGHALAASGGSLLVLVLARLILGAGMSLALIGLSTLAAQAAGGRPSGALFGTLELVSKAGAVVAGVVASVSHRMSGPVLPVIAGAFVATVVTVCLTAILTSTRSRLRRSSAITALTCAPAASTQSQADLVTTHTLLNCLVREVSGPEGQLVHEDGHLVIRLPRRDIVVRAQIRRTCVIGAHRFTGPAQALGEDGWADIGWHQLAEYVEQELELRTGVTNDEFVSQVASSHHTITAALRQRAAAPAIHPDPYLASEQALVYGHRYHPTPKAYSFDVQTWLPYAPEVGARLRLRWLAVPYAQLRQQCSDWASLELFERLGHALRTAATPPRTHALLPVHPWQFALLGRQLNLRDVVDLGEDTAVAVPTSSVRTVWHPDAEAFLKFSLNVRITNCFRKNSDYELAAAVTLTELLRPIVQDIRARFPGTVVLAEPAYRTLDGAPELVEGFGVIIREGLHQHCAPGVTALLAATIADEHATSPAHVYALIKRAGGSSTAAVTWLRDYASLLIPPVLYAYFQHGVVFEPHLQNVVVGIGPDGRPRQVFLRDMEGTKLVPARHAGALSTMSETVRQQVSYDAQRGWNRIVYCLLVNHVAEVIAAIADGYPHLERSLWDQVRVVLEDYITEHDPSPQLLGLLSGVPLPAKANLLTRWERKADRHATYVPLINPLYPATAGATATEQEEVTR